MLDGPTLARLARHGLTPLTETTDGWRAYAARGGVALLRDDELEMVMDAWERHRRVTAPTETEG